MRLVQRAQRYATDRAAPLKRRGTAALRTAEGGWSARLKLIGTIALGDLKRDTRRSSASAAQTHRAEHPGLWKPGLRAAGRRRHGGRAGGASSAGFSGTAVHDGNRLSAKTQATSTFARR